MDPDVHRNNFKQNPPDIPTDLQSQLSKLNQKSGLVVSKSGELKSASAWRLFRENFAGLFSAFGATDQTKGVQQKVNEFIYYNKEDLNKDPSIRNEIIKLAGRAGITVDKQITAQDKIVISIISQAKGNLTVERKKELDIKKFSKMNSISIDSLTIGDKSSSAQNLEKPNHSVSMATKKAAFNFFEKKMPEPANKVKPLSHFRVSSVPTDNVKTNHQALQSMDKTTMSQANHALPVPAAATAQSAASLQPPASSPTIAPKRQWVDEDPSLPYDTIGVFKKFGGYTLQRMGVHEEIKKDIIGVAKPVQSNKKPVAMILMGPPGAGKSTCIETLTKNNKKFVEIGMDNKNFVEIGMDNVMERIPEYKKAINLGKNAEGEIITCKYAADIVRDEAFDITLGLTKEVTETKRNLVYDGTGQHLQDYESMINKLKKQGYDVQVYYVDADIDQIKTRVEARAEVTGRRVPEDVIEDIYKKSKANFQTIAGLADSAALFNNRAQPKNNMQPQPECVCKFKKGELKTGGDYLKANGFPK